MSQPARDRVSNDAGTALTTEPRSALRGLGLRPRKPRKPGTAPTSSLGSLLREIAGILVVAIGGSLIVKTLLVQAFFIPSGSMEPALHGCDGCSGNDRVLVSKLTDHFGGVHRGDIVVFRDSGGWLAHQFATPGLQGRVHNALVMIGLVPDSSGSNLVKRVIGVGGDTVESRDGEVYVNGSKLDEPYVFSGDSPSDMDFRVTVPADKLWVMGDHRSASADSRFHQEDPGKGFVPVDDVVGRAFVVVWPLGRAGILDRPATFDQSFVSAGG